MDLLGTDLRLWDALEGGEGARGEPDLRLRPRPGVTYRRETEPDRISRYPVDAALVAGPANLAQALVHRLLTREGELAVLGHADYGSRLHLLVGERNTDSNRRLLKLFVLEALAREERVRRDRIAVEVQTHPAEPTAVVARIKVEPVDRSGPLEFDFTFRF
ncbi:MAG TPA: hypothetical protein VNT75_28375 [Symbiobacteriaceae bacterium]|nr:hypothetical protein [Symbiobacteriaceae bacterium]